MTASSLSFQDLSLRERCSYSEFFWSVFSHIWTEYGEISVRMGEKRTRKTPNTDTFHAVSRFLIYELLSPKANEETFGETNQKALLRRSERILGTLKKYIIHENSLQLYLIL